MDQLYEQKDATLVFRSVLEAAEELDKDQALELLTSYIHLGLGDNVDLDTCSMVVRLILKQNVASLVAADKRHKNAILNGMKGKDSGIKGAEYGKKGGRPRNNETKEEAYARRNPPKTPQETPAQGLDNTQENATRSSVGCVENPPKTPLKEEEEVYVEEEEYAEEEKMNTKYNLPTCKIDNLEQEKLIKDFEKDDLKEMSDSFHYNSQKVSLNEDMVRKGFECCKTFVNTYKQLDYQQLLTNPMDFLTKYDIKLGCLSQTISSNTGVSFSKTSTTQLLKDYVEMEVTSQGR